MKNRIHVLLRLGAALSLLAIAANAAEPENLAVPFETGKAQFARGDSIVIEKVTGTADSFQSNQAYCVDGKYTLVSHDEAELALFLTSKSDVPTKIDPHQKMRVTKGSGTFRLTARFATQGNPHVSFYPSRGGGSFGGVYFGKGEWLWAGSGGATLPAGNSETSGRDSGKTLPVSGANRALLSYLGEPVDPPASLEAAYRPEGLRSAVESAASNAGIPAPRIAIDDSEFPYLIWVTGDEAAFARLKEQVGKLKEYEYYGSVGGNEAHTFTIIPPSAWPAGAQARIYRRATLRMQVFYDRMSQKNETGRRRPATLLPADQTELPAASPVCPDHLSAGVFRRWARPA